MLFFVIAIELEVKRKPAKKDTNSTCELWDGIEKNFVRLMLDGFI